jgi:predicted alpha/beta superfamily hydrolase
MQETAQEPQIQAEPERNHYSSITGDLRVHEFRSRIFRNTRKLRVWLPPGYTETSHDQRYPVLYLQDGQNLFDRVTAFGGVEWQVDETADRLIREGVIPPMIIVGIDNTGRDRMREYIPYRSFNPPVLRPQGKRYPEFMLREVLPFIEKQYRVAKGPEHTGIGGSSLGGLISLYTAIAATGTFGRLLIESPSLYMAGRAILKDARSLVDWAHRVYLGIGTRESGNENRDAVYVEDLRELEAILRRHGLGPDRLQVIVQQDANHSEAAWAARFPEALAFLFGKRKA